ncbi:MAG: hypothetical protein ACK5NG_00120 [Chthoniobacterales bacterium]
MIKLTLTLMALVAFTLGSAVAGSDCGSCGDKDKKGKKDKGASSEGMTVEVVNI